jgi:hypothetical protein
MSVSITLLSQLYNDPVYLNLLAFWWILRQYVTTAWNDDLTKTCKYVVITCKEVLAISQPHYSNLGNINYN